MSVLESVLNHKRLREAEAKADIQAIPAGVGAFISGKQQAQKSQLDLLTNQVSAAKSGLDIIQDPQGNYGLKPNPNLLEQMTKQTGVYSFNPLTGALDLVTNVPKGSVVRNETPIEDRKAVKEMERAIVTENPNIDADTQKAVAAYEFIEPRLNRVKEIIASKPWGDEGFGKISKQLTINPDTNELIVPNDYGNDASLEELVGLINDMRITGFGLGGASFTEFEGKRIEGGMSPIGKSDARYLSDLDRLPDFFKAKARAGTVGLKEVREKFGKQEPLKKPTKSNSSGPAEGTKAKAKDGTPVVRRNGQWVAE